MSANTAKRLSNGSKSNVLPRLIVPGAAPDTGKKSPAF